MIIAEDPWYGSHIVPYAVEGIQSVNVIALSKHLVCNEQEYNRDRVNIIVDERTLRDIYLRTFEAAIKKGKTGGIMESYNLVNGIKMADNYHILQEVNLKYN